MWKLRYEKRVFKDLDLIPSKDITRLQIIFENLKSEPRRPGVQKLKGTSNQYRIRQGDYRVIFLIDDQEKVITILAVRHRKGVYRNIN